MQNLTLNGKPVSLSSRQGRRFLADFYKTMQQKLTVAELRLKYQITAETIKHLADDPAFIDAVRASRDKRKLLAKTRSNVVELHPQPHFEDDHELIENLARYSEGLLTEKEVKKRHKLEDGAWTAMADNDVLVEKIDQCKLQRIRSGACKRERAQAYVVEAPRVLSGIMMDDKASPKHRIDSAKVLDSIATPPGEAAAADSSRFVITINMGSETVSFNKSRMINVDDNDDPDNTMIAAIAANKHEDDDGGQNHI